MLYKVTKQSLNGLIVIGPDFVSNGYWAIKKDYMANRELFTSEEVAEVAFPKTTASVIEAPMANVSPKPEECTEFYRTHILTDDNGGQLTRLYYNPKHAQFAGYNEKYLDMLGKPDTLIARDNLGSAMDAAQHAFVIMPLRLDMSQYEIRRAAGAAPIEKAA